MGYGIATLYLQIATFALHPAQSLAWTLGITMTFGVALLGMKRWGERLGPPPIPLAEAA